MLTQNARHALICGVSLVSLVPVLAHADDADSATEVVVVGQRPAPKSPATAESVTAETLARTVNVVTPEDTLRYVPNVLIRQRHIGDTQSPVTTRTSGVGASARSLIYVDGILLSALIGNNNTSASPKWGLIAPEAVERVDVMYGPFSAAYAGNSLGSVIEFTTRMPKKLEGTLEIQSASQAFKLYGDDDSYGTGRFAASIGDRFGNAAFRLSYNHLDSHSQPLGYATATGSAANSGNGASVTGAFDDVNRTGAAIKVLGATGLEHQMQDNLSGRFTYDITPEVTAAYTFGLFRNQDDATIHSYLRDGGGQPVYAGTVNIDGKSYTIANSAFSNGVYDLDETQLAQAVSLESRGGGVFDYELVVSHFLYLKSHQRTPTGALPAAFAGGAGLDVQLDGTGWTTLDAKGIWRPNPAHTVSFGAHRDSFELDNPKYALSDWRNGANSALQTLSAGRTDTSALWLQDTWKTGDIRTTLGGRWESWQALGGRNFSASPALSTNQPRLKKQAFSPKAVIAWLPDARWQIKASLGVAYRFPTVTELYQAVTTGPVLSVPDPNLRPERALSSELSVMRNWTSGNVRVSLFDERIHDALISQTGTLNGSAATFVQNVERTHASGIELVADQKDILPHVELSGWLTWVDARIDSDPALPAAEGKRLPQLPRLRGALVATWEPTPKWDVTAAVRYSDAAFGTIDNSDTNHNTWMGFAGYTVVDLHVRYAIDAHWSAEAGIDNANDADYFLFHPFPQRTVIAGLKYTY